MKIDKLKPKVIITEGIQTFDLLRKVLKSTKDPEFKKLKIGSRDRRIFAKSDSENIPIGIIHLTGARPSDTELQVIKDLLSKEL